MWASKTVLSLLVAILILLVAMGCSSTQEVQYKTISFSDTNGVTTVYYPITMEKYIVPDDGKAKLMLIKP